MPIAPSTNEDRYCRYYGCWISAFPTVAMAESLKDNGGWKAREFESSAEWSRITKQRLRCGSEAYVELVLCSPEIKTLKGFLINGSCLQLRGRHLASITKNLCSGKGASSFGAYSPRVRPFPNGIPPARSVLSERTAFLVPLGTIVWTTAQSKTHVARRRRGRGEVIGNPLPIEFACPLPLF